MQTLGMFIGTTDHFFYCFLSLNGFFEMLGSSELIGTGDLLSDRD